MKRLDRLFVRRQAACRTVKRHRKRSRKFELLEKRFVLTELSGTITSDMSFTDPADPLLIDGEVFIRNGATLTIGTGVNVSFTPFGTNRVYISDNGSGGTLNADGATFGVDVEFGDNGGGTIQNSTIESRTFTVNAGANPVFQDSVFHDDTPIYVAPEYVPELGGRGNSFGIGATIGVSGGVIDQDTDWPNLPGAATYDLAIFDRDDVFVRDGATLTIGSGMRLFDDDAIVELYISDNGSGGTLLADGVTFDGTVEFGDGGTGVIENSTVASQTIAVDAGATPIFTDNNFHEGRPLYLDPEFVPSIDGRGNTFAPSATIAIQGGVIDQDTTWPNLPDAVTYDLAAFDRDDVFVRDGATLTIESGMRLFDDDALVELYISDNGSGGTLLADGVTFDGDVVFGDNGGGLIDNSTVASQRIQVDAGATPVLRRSHFHGGTPLYLDPEFVPELAGESNTFGVGATISIQGGVIDQDTLWPAWPDAATYSLSDFDRDDIFVRDGATLTIGSGMRIFDDDALVELMVSDDGSGGTLNAAGVVMEADVTFGPGSRGQIRDSVQSSQKITVQSDALPQFIDVSFHDGIPLLVNPEFVHPLFGNRFGSGATIQILAGTIDSSVQWPNIPNVRALELIGDVAVRNSGKLTIWDGVLVERDGTQDDLLIGDDGIGGAIDAHWVVFDVIVELGADSSGRIDYSRFQKTLNIDGRTSVVLEQNDFADVEAVVGIDNSPGTIDLTSNWWGTTDAGQIESVVEHQPDNASRPLIDYDPYLSAAPEMLHKISGIKFEDLNANGVRGTGEPGLGGIMVYLDENADGDLDLSERRLTTANDNPITPSFDETGQYFFDRLAAATYVLREELPGGFRQTLPNPDAQSTTILFNGADDEDGITELGAGDFVFEKARFSGGTVFSTATTSLLASGSEAYRIDTTAVVQFEQPVDEVQFFYVHGGSVPAGTATVLGIDGSTLGMLDSLAATTFGDVANFVSLNPTEPISRIEFDGGAVDNFHFLTDDNNPAWLVAVSGGVPAKDIDFGNHRLPSLDFGDAPASFGTRLADDGARHVITDLGQTLFLGLTSPDPEPEGVPGSQADSDDTSTDDDEDGAVDEQNDFLLIETGESAVDFRVTNNTGSLARLYGWIDYDQDGVFENGTERAMLEVPDGTDGELVTLSFPDVPLNSQGATFARFRLSTDTAAADPIGLVTDGEVEDYPVLIEGAPVLSVADMTVNEDAGLGQVTISLDQASSFETQVDFQTIAGSATDGRDYSGVSGTLLIPAGAKSATVKLPIVDDSLDEATEDLQFVLSDPVLSLLHPTNSSATISIQDNDDAVGLQIDDVVVAESADKVTFTVSVTDVSGREVSADFATGDLDAVAGEDYKSTKGSVAIAAGEVSTTVSIDLTDDLIDEPLEQFELKLSTPVNATLVDDQGLATLLDDEALPDLTIANISVDEAAGDAILELLLSGPSSRDVEIVTRTRSGSAEAGVDFSALDPGAATIAAGTTSTSILVPIVSDKLDEAHETFSVLLTAATNAAIADEQAVVTILDDDVAFLVSESDGSTVVSEDESTDEVAIVLTKPPLSDVILKLDLPDDGEATLNKTSLTFTTADWDTPQLVTVTGVDDDRVDDLQTQVLTVSVDDAASEDRFDDLADQQISVLNHDNDAPAFTVREQSLNSFSVALSHRPLSNVVFQIESDDPGEVVPSLALLTFPPDAWDTPQTVDVRPVDDITVDGEQNATITVAIDPDASDDAFDNLPSRLVPVTVDDNDLAGFQISQTDGETAVSELKAQDEFSVVLSAQPVSDVVLMIESDDPGEVDILDTRLVFTPDNWDVPQSVTVEGVDDVTVDGEQTAEVSISVVLEQSQPAFGLLEQQTVAVVIADDDDPGFAVSEPAGGARVEENGASASFQVSLVAQPLTDVVVIAALEKPEEVDIQNAVLTFTPQNWNTGQTIVVSAVDDVTVDGSIESEIRFDIDPAESDTAFDMLERQTFVIRTEDNDQGGFAIRETDGSTLVDEASLPDHFEVVLTARPLSDVVFNVTSDDPDEVAVTESELTFTPDNWAQAQSVNLDAVDDMTVDGRRTTLISVAVAGKFSDAAFAGLPGQSVEAFSDDNDLAGIEVFETSGTTQILEGGSGDEVQVVLPARPLSEVRVSVRSLDTDQFTIVEDNLTFTPDNWDTPQTVELLAVDDPAVDGLQERELVVAVIPESSDPAFQDVNETQITVAITDNDLGGFVFTETDDETTLREDGVDGVRLALSAQPLSDVVLRIESNNLEQATTDRETVRFTPRNWNIIQGVRILGVDDVSVDGEQTATISISVDQDESDDAFDQVAAMSFLATITDNDVAGVVLVETGEGTTIAEQGNSDQLSLTLAARPLTDVVVQVQSADEEEVGVAGEIFTFTPATWDAPQVIEVLPVDDLVVDGAQNTVLTFSVVPDSSDDAFDAVSPVQVVVATLDDDLAGFRVTETEGGTVVREGAKSETLEVVLTAQPLTPVVIETSPIPGQTRIIHSELTFTPDNWDTAQTVQIVPIDDLVVEGELTAQLQFAIDPDRTDAAFRDLADQSISVTLEDNDVGGFEVLETGDSTSVSESGTVDTLTVNLTAQPLSNVVLTLSSLDASEFLPVQQEIVFTPADWDVSQSIEISGVADTVNDGEQTGILIVAVNDLLTDPGFQGLSDVEVSVRTSDVPVSRIEVRLEGNEIVVRDAITGRVLDRMPADVETILIETEEGDQTVDLEDPGQTLIPTDIRTGPGDDIVLIDNLDFGRWEGGPGFDRLEIGSVNNDLTLGHFVGTLEDIELLEFTGRGPNEIVVTAVAISDLSPDAKQITIGHDSDDVIRYIEQWKVDPPEFVDGLLEHVLKQGESTLRIRNSTPWQNPFDPLDQNRDGFVVPGDALLPINEINANGSGVLPVPTSIDEIPAFYYDTNGDGELSPIDVLIVINFLNEGDPEGESLLMLDPGWQPTPRFAARVMTHASDLQEAARASRVTQLAADVYFGETLEHNPRVEVRLARSERRIVLDQLNPREHWFAELGDETQSESFFD